MTSRKMLVQKAITHIRRAGCHADEDSVQDIVDVVERAEAGAPIAGVIVARDGQLLGTTARYPGSGTYYLDEVTVDRYGLTKTVLDLGMAGIKRTTGHDCAHVHTRDLGNIPTT
jgi:hypothetical protein